MDLWSLYVKVINGILLMGEVVLLPACEEE